MSKSLFCSACLSVFFCFSFCHAQNQPQTGSAEPKVKTYGGAQVKRIGELKDGFTFTCDVADWPAVIGENITVRIDGVIPPQMVLESGQPNNFYNKLLKDYLATLLSSASQKKIKLKNIRRADTFALIAEVTIDGENLAESLIKQGLAQQGEVKKVSLSYSVPMPVAKAGSISSVRNHTSTADEGQIYYVASSSSKVYHKSTCRYAKSLSEDKKVIFKTKAEAESSGRRPCKACNP